MGFERRVQRTRTCSEHLAQGCDFDIVQKDWLLIWLRTWGGVNDGYGNYKFYEWEIWHTQRRATVKYTVCVRHHETLMSWWGDEALEGLREMEISNDYDERRWRDERISGEVLYRTTRRIGTGRNTRHRPAVASGR